MALAFLLGESMDDVKSVLVYVGGDHKIGDATIKLPLALAVRRAFPQARVTWLAGVGRSALAHELAGLVGDALDEVIENAGVGRSWTELFDARPLGGRRFDVIVDTQLHLLATLAVRRIPHRRFVSGAAGFLLSAARPVGGRRPPEVTRQLAQLLELACGHAVDWHNGVPLPAAARAEAARLLPEGPVYVGFAPGSAEEKKRWPLDRFLAVAREQAETGRVPAFLLGPQEAGWVETVRAALPEARLPLQEAGAMTPELTAALGGRLAAAVSNDCGAAHLLALSGVPMVSLFGPSSARKFRPFTPRCEVLDARVWGRPDIDAIPVEAVSAALARLTAI